MSSTGAHVFAELDGGDQKRTISPPMALGDIDGIDGVTEELDHGAGRFHRGSNHWWRQPCKVIRRSGR